MEKGTDAGAAGSVFLIADEDLEAAERMTGFLSSKYFYILVRTGAETLRYVGGFSLAGVLLSETLPCEEGGAETVLDRLVEHGVEVVVLSEQPEAPNILRWRERGAFDCVAHATKMLTRLVALRGVNEELYWLTTEAPRSKFEGAQ